MKSIVEKIRLLWGKFLAILRKEGFVWSYPLLVLTVIAIASRSILVMLALAVWVIAVIANSDEE